MCTFAVILLTDRQRQHESLESLTSCGYKHRALWDITGYKECIVFSLVIATMTNMQMVKGQRSNARDRYVAANIS